MPEGRPLTDAGDPLATLTHARLRAAQGDLGGAVRLAHQILEARPGHAEAEELLRSLRKPEIRARVARLRAWLDVILAG